MLKKQSLVSALLVAGLLVSFAACSPKAEEAPPTPSASQSQVESSQPEEESPPEASQPTVEPEQPVEPDQASGLMTSTEGNISFTHRDDLEVKVLEGSPYFYYNDSSFFFLGGGPGPGENAGDLTKSDAEEFFAIAEQSYQVGTWSNGKIITDVNLITANGLDIWYCEFEMTHQSGVEFTSSAALIYHDGWVTTITLVSDVDSYPTSAVEFADTLLSLTPVPA